MYHWDYQAMYGMPQQQWQMGWPQQQMAMPQQQMMQQPQMPFEMMPQQPVSPEMMQQQQLFVPPMPAARPPWLDLPGMLPMEMSYIENILRLNRGKMATLYFTYENNPEWPAVTYRGLVEEAGRDHIVISDPETGRWYLLLMVNLDYVVFEEEIEYDYPFNGISPAAAGLAEYPPR